MVRKRQKQRAAVGRLGKYLTRRSRGRCETCSSQDDVRAYEMLPYEEEPDPERTLMVCARCRDWLEKENPDAKDAWFLSEAVWSEKAPVRLAAARMLLLLDDPGNPWISETFEAAGVDPLTGEFAEKPVTAGGPP